MSHPRIAALFAALLFPLVALAQDDTSGDSEFIKPTIDLGCVVSDIDASVKFYTEAIGFEVSDGFEVSGDFAAEAGLTDAMLDIRVLTLGTGKGATNFKLMEVKGGSKSLDNQYINSTLGFSYITIFVKSTDAAMARLKKAGVKPLAKGPVTLPKSLDPTMALTVVRDPDGNFVELVGPKPAAD